MEKSWLLCPCFCGNPEYHFTAQPSIFRQRLRWNCINFLLRLLLKKLGTITCKETIPLSWILSMGFSSRHSFVQTAARLVNATRPIDASPLPWKCRCCSCQFCMRSSVCYSIYYFDISSLFNTPHFQTNTFFSVAYLISLVAIQICTVAHLLTISTQ